MQPNRIGRILGVTTRVAGEKLREQADRLAAASAARPESAPPPARAVAVPSAPSRPAPAANPASAAEEARRMARGAGRFGAALVRPFAHATGVLWNQIVGIFFALFALLFAEHAWILYKSSGLRDRHLILYSVLALLFAWFAVSSFWRARRRQKQT